MIHVGLYVCLFQTNQDYESLAFTVDELQPEEDLDTSPTEDLDKYLEEPDREGERDSSDHTTPDDTPEQGQDELHPDEQSSESADHDQVFLCIAQGLS